MRTYLRGVIGGACLATAVMALLGFQVATPIVVITGGLGALAWFAPSVLR
jgi:hypothetical protein